jgi:hypothetical protein
MRVNKACGLSSFMRGWRVTKQCLEHSRFLSTVVLLVTFTFVCMPSVGANDISQSVVVKTDTQRVLGRWVRPDGGYILELKEVGKDNTLEAAYFNPRPINVAKSVFSRKDGRLTIFIELRDVNYPGSKYNLQYDPKTDQLKGTYFQAIQKQTFDVEFMRVK